MTSMTATYSEELKIVYHQRRLNRETSDAIFAGATTDCQNSYKGIVRSFEKNAKVTYSLTIIFIKKVYFKLKI